MHGTPISLTTPRLSIRPFTPADAPVVFACTTPTLTRYMDFDPSPSEAAFAEVWRSWLPLIESRADITFVLRDRHHGGFLGLAAVHRTGDPTPELGIWIREDAHGHGYGREAVAAIAHWAASTFQATVFIYPVARDNQPSRRLIEALGGQLQGDIGRTKYAAVQYLLKAADLRTPAA